MEKIVSPLIRFFLIIIICLSFSACKETATKNKTDVWSQATYTQDTEIGDGEKTVFVEVVAEEKAITFTIHSDKDTLGEALIENSLIDGEKGAYGLYVKKVNGIIADYDVNQCYWGFSKEGERMVTGVDGVKFENGEHYELVYTK